MIGHQVVLDVLALSTYISGSGWRLLSVLQSLHSSSWKFGALLSLGSGATYSLHKLKFKSSCWTKVCLNIPGGRISSLKQIFICYWEAPLPFCFTPIFCHRSYFEHWGVLLSVEPCHPLYNLTKGASSRWRLSTPLIWISSFFLCKDPKTARIDISLRMYRHFSKLTQRCKSQAEQLYMYLSLWSREPCDIYTSVSHRCAAKNLHFQWYLNPGVVECFGISTPKNNKIHCLITERLTQLYIQQHLSVMKAAAMLKGWHAAAW